jgi:HEAT repeats
MRIDAECAAHGRDHVVDGCVAILQASGIDEDLVLVLGGEHGALVVAGGDGGLAGYWPRVWAARGLLHCWAPRAEPALQHALGDDAWRVREMAAKVVARHGVGACFDEVLGLRDDAVPRVREAALRAVRRLTEDLA